MAAWCGSTNRPGRSSPCCRGTLSPASSPGSCSACRCASPSKKTTAGRCCGPDYRSGPSSLTGRATRSGRSRPPARWWSWRRLTTGRRSDRMTRATTAPPRLSSQPPPAPAGTSPWLAAVAVVPILATVYQTLVLTDVTDDVIRKGITAEHYSMIWTNVCWGVTIIYGLFAGIWAMARYGGRDTLLVGLVWFAVGNLLCGAATDVPTMAAAKLVEGVGKGMVIVICRSLLYRQFDRMVIVAIGFYGVIAYATRPTTPLLTALINDALSWRWIFWANVPLALLAVPLVWRFIKPDRPARPLPLRIDWISVTLFVTWIVSLTFVCGWYRKWGGWRSNSFTAMALLALLLPVVLVAWVSSGLSVSEHLRRMFRVRIYVLAMCVRMLMLLQLLVVLSLLAKYCVALRDYPREVAGLVLV